MKRAIIEIDEELCDGCGQCVNGCAESAIKIIDGKAKLIGDSYCDGLGMCIGHCPVGALKIVEREAEPFDEELVNQHIQKQKQKQEQQTSICGCPGQTARTKPGKALNNWPLQLMLVPEKADYFDNDDGILLAADCAALSHLNFHNEFVKGKTVLMGCPKLDDAAFYTQKLARIFAINDIKNITVARMEVPCCSGLMHIVHAAIILSKKKIKPEEVVISLA